MNRTSKNTWALFLLILAGIVLGGFIGSFAEGVPYLSWLNYGMNFGMDTPLALDFKVIFLQFQIKLFVNITSIIGTIIAIIIYKKL
ncbi:MAG: DUF4321 domain-containing protein [Vallitaleaceae bacterium]|nr:DUF4321 domain-containing protein [Vallitaleaceae bacterium]